jgi:hypothetical protein
MAGHRERKSSDTYNPITQKKGTPAGAFFILLKGDHMIKTNLPDAVLVSFALLQRQPNQPIRLIRHKQRNIQHIIIQLQIIQ